MPGATRHLRACPGCDAVRVIYSFKTLKKRPPFLYKNYLQFISCNKCHIATFGPIVYASGWTDRRVFSPAGGALRVPWGEPTPLCACTRSSLGARGLRPPNGVSEAHFWTLRVCRVSRPLLLHGNTGPWGQSHCGVRPAVGPQEEPWPWGEGGQVGHPLAVQPGRVAVFLLGCFLLMASPRVPCLEARGRKAFWGEEKGGWRPEPLGGRSKAGARGPPQGSGLRRGGTSRPR